MSGFRMNRLFSAPLTRVLLKTPLTPNQITMTSLGFGVLAGVLFAQGGYGFALAAAASYATAMVLDNCDGEVARAKNMRSELGGWLDVAADLVSDLSLFTGIAFGVMHREPSAPAGLFLALCLSGGVLHFLLVVAEKLKGFGPAVFGAPHPEHEKRKSAVLGAFDALREGDACWLVLLAALCGRADIVLWAGGVYMQVLWIAALFINFRWTFGKKR